MSSKPQCPSENAIQIDQTTFWNGDNVNWSPHRIGWTIAGVCTAVLSLLLSSVLLLKMHRFERGAGARDMASILTPHISTGRHVDDCSRNYNNPRQQRQIIRIIYLPPVYAIISFFSYRFFQHYTYYVLIQIVYEAIAMGAFLMLIIEYVASTAANHDADTAIERKDKNPLPIPFCCWRYRPTKAYFMYTVKWSVLQYVIVRPLISVIAIICEARHILCESGPYSIHFAAVYLEAIDFVSISVALYGLVLFYGLTKDELKGRRPLAKFLVIKLIVMFTFYQSFVFNAMKGRVIHATPYWTETNIKNGLNALAICIEMVIFSAAMLWAYPVKEYRKPGIHTKILRPLIDSINYRDFGHEIWSSLKFFIDYFRGVPTTHGHGHKANFAEAFGVEGSPPLPQRREENVRLEPYPPSRTSV